MPMPPCPISPRRRKEMEALEDLSEKGMVFPETAGALRTCSADKGGMSAAWFFEMARTMGHYAPGGLWYRWWRICNGHRIAFIGITPEDFPHCRNGSQQCLKGGHGQNLLAKTWNCCYIFVTP